MTFTDTDRNNLLALIDRVGKVEQAQQFIQHDRNITSALVSDSIHNLTERIAFLEEARKPPVVEPVQFHGTDMGIYTPCDSCFTHLPCYREVAAPCAHRASKNPGPAQPVPVSDTRVCEERDAARDELRYAKLELISAKNIIDRLMHHVDLPDKSSLSRDAYAFMGWDQT